MVACPHVPTIYSSISNKVCVENFRELSSKYDLLQTSHSIFSNLEFGYFRSLYSPFCISTLKQILLEL